MFSDNKVIFEFRGPFGVPVQVGSSFLMLALFIVFMGGGAASLPFQLAFLAMITVSIFLHEMGHAWGCLIQGIPVARIMIHGGGGFCQPAQSPSRHQDEFIVAMGPIMNLGLWAIVSLLMNFTVNPILYWAMYTFAYLNLFLGVVNLLPVMPLDGGRLLQYMLMRFMGPLMARKVAGGVGVLIALLWIPAMIYFYVYVGFILLFFPSIKMHWVMLRS